MYEEHRYLCHRQAAVDFQCHDNYLRATNAEDEEPRQTRDDPMEELGAKQELVQSVLVENPDSLPQ